MRNSKRKRGAIELWRWKQHAQGQCGTLRVAYEFPEKTRAGGLKEGKVQQEKIFGHRQHISVASTKPDQCSACFGWERVTNAEVRERACGRFGERRGTEGKEGKSARDGVE